MYKDFKVDGHIHTFECGHAYNTITEMAKAGKENGMELICWTEHGPGLPNGSTFSFFNNMRVIPPEIEGVRVLKGMEANILPNGKLDLYKNLRNKMEVVSASLHNATFPPQSKEENTEAVISALQNPYVDYVCHLGNPRYPIDYETVIKEAKKNNKIIEINNGSFYIRKGSKDNCINIAELCKKHDVPVIVGTDAHWSGAVGRFPYARKALEIAEFPEELIMNTDPQKLLNYLEAKGKPLGQYREDEAVDIFDDFDNEEEANA